MELGVGLDHPFDRTPLHVPAGPFDVLAAQGRPQRAAETLGRIVNLYRPGAGRLSRLDSGKIFLGAALSGSQGAVENRQAQGENPGAPHRQPDPKAKMQTLHPGKGGTGNTLPGPLALRDRGIFPGPLALRDRGILPNLLAFCDCRSR